MAVAGYHSEHLARITALSVVRRASAPVQFCVLLSEATPRFEVDFRALLQERGSECFFVRYPLPSWMPLGLDRGRGTALSRLLFFDLVLPLNTGRAVIVEPGIVFNADVVQLADTPLGTHSGAFVPHDLACVATEFTLWELKKYRKSNPRLYVRGALFVVDMPSYRMLSVGAWIRIIVRNALPLWCSGVHEDTLATLICSQMRGTMLPMEWGWCSLCPAGELGLAKALSACENARTLRRDFAFMRSNVSLWRKLELELAASQ
jgi:hypothetical protein